MTQLFAGIDPGKHGGLSVVDENYNVIECHDTPETYLDRKILIGAIAEVYCLSNIKFAIEKPIMGFTREYKKLEWKSCDSINPLFSASEAVFPSGGYRFIKYFDDGSCGVHVIRIDIAHPIWTHPAIIIKDTNIPHAEADEICLKTIDELNIEKEGFTQASSIAKLHADFGVWIGILAAYGIEPEIVTPQQWGKSFLGSGRQKARVEIFMKAKYPKFVLGPKGGYKDGRGDSIGIAVHLAAKEKKATKQQSFAV